MRNHHQLAEQKEVAKIRALEKDLKKRSDFYACETNALHMISVLDLKSVSKGRLRDAEVLQRAGRFDGAVYMCGYTVEVALKARACRTLKWPGFPETKKEFEGLQSFKTHNLEILLHLSGAEGKIRSKFIAEWSIVLRWNPESRYQKMGTATKQDAVDMIAAAKRLLGAL